MADSEGAELLELHLRWRGGRHALRQLDNLSLSGQVEVGALSGPIEQQLTSEGWSRLHFDLGVIRRTEVVGPGEGFCLNASGQPEPLPASEAERIRLEGALLLGRLPEAVERLPDEDKEGQRWAVLRVRSPGGAEQELLLDPLMGALTWTRHREDARTVWVRYEDWREVNGVRAAHRVQTLPEIEGADSVVTWSEVRANGPIDPGLFSRPERRSCAIIEGGASSTGWLPIDLYRGRWVYLRGTLHGQETDIVLDSGAGATVVDTALADRLGLVRAGQMPVQGVGGTQEAGWVKGLHLVVGPLSLEVSGIVLDLSGVGRELGRPMPVILGKEVFHDLVVDLDYPRQRIAFHQPETFRPEGTGTTVPLLPGPGGHRLVHASLEGLPDAPFVLDTGSGGTVDVFEAYTQRHGLLEGRRTSETLTGGVGGMNVYKSGTLRSFRFAGYELYNVPARFASGTAGAFHSVEQAGNLGAALFGRFRLVFDYSREQLHVSPGPDWDVRPFPKNRLGLALRLEEEPAPVLVVQFVSPGSPAERAGFRAGERIAALDGASMTPERWAEAREALAMAPSGTVVRLTREGGGDVVLVLEDYD